MRKKTYRYSWPHHQWHSNRLYHRTIWIVEDKCYRKKSNRLRKLDLPLYCCLKKNPQTSLWARENKTEEMIYWNVFTYFLGNGSCLQLSSSDPSTQCTIPIGQIQYWNKQMNWNRFVIEPNRYLTYRHNISFDPNTHRRYGIWTYHGHMQFSGNCFHLRRLAKLNRCRCISFKSPNCIMK